jgi:hypothetical protein
MALGNGPFPMSQIRRGYYRLLLPVKQEDFRRTSLTISMICRSFGVSLSGFLSEPEQEKNLSKQELTRAVRARLW